MMNVTSAHTKLNLLLNNTNKALVQVLLDATKDDIKNITKDSKDLRSIMDKVLKETKNSEPSSNKAMLDLVKKNPTLNNLGSPSVTIKKLIDEIKTDKNPLPIEKVLKEALVDIKDVKNVNIKSKLDNSGVFLENKIKNITNPQVEVKNTLVDLKETLQQSKLPQAKETLKKVELILQDNIVKKATNNDLVKDVKQNPKSLENLSKEINALVKNTQSLISKADPVYSNDTKEIINKLEFAITKHKTKIPLENVSNNVSKDKNDLVLNTNEVKVKQAQPLSAQNLQNMKISSHILEPTKVQVMQEKNIQTQINPNNTTSVQNTSVQTTVLVDDVTIKLPIIKETLQALQNVLDKSLTLESKTALKSLNTILVSLDTNKEMSEGLTKDISKLIQDTKEIVKKADVVYSKDMLTIFSKLKHIDSQSSLSVHSNVKEMLSGDLKSTLLQTMNEVQSSSSPNKNELIKHMDKLLLQIDHYQLISHLSNSSTVYLPITWDQLEGGEIDIRKDSDKFYCDIDLNLKDYGDVNLKLTLFEKNQINIHLYSPNQELKELFQENLTLLRAGMIGAQIIPREIRFHDGLEKTPTTPTPYQGDDDFRMGFEVKG